MARYRVAHVTPADLCAAFNGGACPRWLGVPADATVATGWFDPARDSFVVVVAHPSFDDVPVGGLPPVIPTAYLMPPPSGTVKVSFGPAPAPAPAPAGPASWRDRPPLL